MTDVETRLSNLERILGVGSGNTSRNGRSSENNNNNHHPNIESRLTLVQNRIQNGISDQKTLQWKELEQQLTYADADGGLFLSSSTSQEKPHMYKRLEVLAQKERLEQDMKQLLRIKEYLLMNHHTTSKQQQPAVIQNKNPPNQLPVQVVTESPLLKHSSYEQAQSMETRLANVQTQIKSIMTETHQLTNRIDEMVDKYYQQITVMNQKFTQIMTEDC